MRRWTDLIIALVILACATVAVRTFPPVHNHDGGLDEALSDLTWVRPEGTRRPLVVLDVMGMWLATEPRFVLYDDGLVITALGDFACPRFEWASLSPSERDALLSELRFDDEKVSIGMVPDSTISTLLRWDGRRYRRLVLRGRPEVSENSAIRTAGTYRAPGARPWFPPQFLITLEPAHENIPQRPWPAGWPDLRSTQARTAYGRHATGTHEIPVTSSRYLEFQRTFKGTLADNGAYTVNDTNVLVWFRLPFPEETAWMNSLDIP